MERKNLKRIVLILFIIAVLIPAAVIGSKVFTELNGDKENGNIAKEKKNIAVKKYDKPKYVKPQLASEIIYDRYLLDDKYVVVDSSGARIYSGPDYNSSRAGWASGRAKISCLWVQDGWYRIKGEYLGRAYDGYISADRATYREYRINEMWRKIKKLDKKDFRHKILAVDNYNSRNGKAPLWNGNTFDAFGNHRGASAPMYFKKPELIEENGHKKVTGNYDFCYVPDGTLVSCIKKGKEFTKVSILDQNKTGYLQNKYLEEYKEFKEISLIAVVDVKNQNQVIFQKKDNVWRLISKTLCTTGKSGTYSVPTEPGMYGMVQKKPQLYYLKDGTNELEGYAPYAVRFNGGAYIHGVPRNYIFPKIPDPLDPTKLIDDKTTRIDPGHAEFSASMGTIPLSHKCVRNYTSHAKFLYDIFQENKGSVIVIN